MEERREREQKRRADDMTMQLLLEKFDRAEEEALARHIEARKFRIETTRDIRCLAVGFYEFKKKWDAEYGPYLDRDIDGVKVRRAFIHEKIRVWSSRIFDACVAAIGLIFLYGLLAGDWLKKAYGKLMAML